MAEIMQHLSSLADEIGPRPATSDAENRAASYIESVFVARGLEPEVQEFDSPRTYSWSFVLYHLLSIAAAVCAGLPALKGLGLWPSFAVSAIVAFFLMSELDTRAGLTRIMPKGPSQNVIARHVPRARRGEKVKKVVIVAHYDSARSSLAFSPSMVHQFPLTFALMKASTIAIPIIILAKGLPLPGPAAVDTYLWYLALVFGAYLLIPFFINLHRELFMPYVAGANDNASGVAAMLEVLHNLVAEPDTSRFVTSQLTPVRRSAEAAEEAEVVPEGAVLNYTPAGGRASEIPDDFAWAETTPSSTRTPSRGQGNLLDFETIEFAALDEETVRADRARRSGPAPGPGSAPGGDEPLAGSPRAQSGAASGAERKRGGLLGRGKGKKRDEDHDVKGWLGVGEDFDARKAGKDIGSWDNFGDDDDDAGGLGWKGGWAGDDPIGDEDFAATEAARIRRRVTEYVDRELAEKEVWFVATGAEEVGTIGMQHFLEAYGDEVRDALIINIDNIGAGQLAWVTAEGMARRYKANPRLTGLAKRVSREKEILIKPRVYKGLSTDATPALARGYKAMSIMGFDSAGLPINWHWKTDTSDNVEVENIERVADLVTTMIREA